MNPPFTGEFGRSLVRSSELRARFRGVGFRAGTPNLPTNIVDFGGFDSSIMLFLRGGILMSIGNFPESLSRAMLVGIMLVGRLGVTLTL